MPVESKNDLPLIASRLDRALSNLLRKTAFSIEAKAKQLAPVDTGLLRNSIQTTIDSPTKATVGTNVEYAPYQEFGTRHQKGTPFLTPAADDEQKNFEKNVSDIERSLR
jgi:HK97 gp10 family phage protein